MNKFTLLLSGLILVCSVQASEIVVNADGSGDFVTIQAGIDASVDGDTVIVADGLYSGAGNYNIDFANGLPAGTTRAITVKSSTGPANCIIDCQNSGGGFYFHSGEDQNAVLEGFTIINGQYNASGLIVCENSSPDVRNCILKDSGCRGVDCVDPEAIPGSTKQSKTTFPHPPNALFCEIKQLASKIVDASQ